MTTRKLLALAAGLAIACGSLAAYRAYAADGDPGFKDSGIVASAYDPDRQRAAFRTGRAVADSTAIATLTSTTTGRFRVNGRQNIAVSGRFSTAAATCTVRVLYEFVDAVTGTEYPTELSAAATLTATSFTDAAGLYVSQPYVFDGAGATHARIILSGATSAGTVDLWVGSR